MAERVKREEEERLARRKRVEAIMLRTRGKNQSNTPTKVRNCKFIVEFFSWLIFSIDEYGDVYVNVICRVKVVMAIS